MTEGLGLFFGFEIFDFLNFFVGLEKPLLLFLGLKIFFNFFLR